MEQPTGIQIANAGRAAVVLVALIASHPAGAASDPSAGDARPVGLPSTGTEPEPVVDPASIPNGGEAMAWKDRIADQAKRSLRELDEYVDVTWRRFARRMGIGEAETIVAYRGYGDDERIRVTGRLLANKPYGGPQDDDNWWDNLTATYGRWESDEIPDEPIHLEYAGQRKTVRTDAEGYYHAEFDVPSGGPRPEVVVARYDGPDRVLAAVHRVTLPDPDAEFLLVSDMDDTVIHTGITDLLLSAQLTFLNNAKTRKPLVGVGSLYRALARGGGERQVNPVFYVSNSAWNMYDLLRDFLELNDLPDGPLLLRDIGIGSDTSDHKIETIRNLFHLYEELPVVLVGDSGQHDADIYAQLAEEFPERVRAIYIRDVDPADDSEYDVNVDRIIAETERLGVAFLRVGDSLDIAHHLAQIGLLPEARIAEIERDVQIDRHRDTLAEETAGVPAR